MKWTGPDGQTLASGISLNTAWDSKDRPVRVLAFGNSGNASPEQKALGDVFMRHEFDGFLHLGDMACVAVQNDQTHAFLSAAFPDCKASARAIGLDGQDIDTFELDGCD